MKTRPKELITVFLVIAPLCSPAGALIDGSPHDLSAVAGASSCSFCHTPHGALTGTPLWSHKLSDAVYDIYQSSSLEANVGQPTGSSKYCLSCHDGTVALAESVGGPAGGTYITADKDNLGTDLSD
ncbi:MAG: cytochrome c3 family protein, partial [Planctomycetota bacterium]